jgi:hypothetical protein
MTFYRNHAQLAFRNIFDFGFIPKDFQHSVKKNGVLARILFILYAVFVTDVNDFLAENIFDLVLFLRRVGVPLLIKAPSRYRAPPDLILHLISYSPSPWRLHSTNLWHATLDEFMATSELSLEH